MQGIKNDQRRGCSGVDACISPVPVTMITREDSKKARDSGGRFKLLRYTQSTVCEELLTGGNVSHVTALVTLLSLGTIFALFQTNLFQGTPWQRWCDISIYNNARSPSPANNPVSNLSKRSENRARGNLLLICSSVLKKGLPGYHPGLGQS